MSSHQGLDIGPLIDQYKPDHLITKLYQSIEMGGDGAKYSIAHAQSARARGRTVGGYVWLYAGIDGAQQVNSALDTAAHAGIVFSPTNPLWLDCEDYTDGTFPNLEIIRQAVEACESEGFPCGIYTGGWWWKPRTGNSTEFSHLPLWASIYDSSREMVAPGFGGWTALAGKQWSGSPIDRSVFRWGHTEPSTSAGASLINPVMRQGQFERASYDSTSEFNGIHGASCSAASLAATLTAYGQPTNISGALKRIRATGDDVTPNPGLLNRFGAGVGLKRALDAAGLPATVTPQDDLTREWFRERLPEHPALCQLNNYHGGGHWLVAVEADDLGVTVANSDAGPKAEHWFTWSDWWQAMGSGVAVTVD